MTIYKYLKGETALQLDTELGQSWNTSKGMSEYFPSREHDNSSLRYASLNDTLWHNANKKQITYSKKFARTACS